MPSKSFTLSVPANLLSNTLLRGIVITTTDGLAPSGGTTTTSGGFSYMDFTTAVPGNIDFTNSYYLLDTDGTTTTIGNTTKQLKQLTCRVGNLVLGADSESLVLTIPNDASLPLTLVGQEGASGSSYLYFYGKTAPTYGDKLRLQNLFGTTNNNSQSLWSDYQSYVFKTSAKLPKAGTDVYLSHDSNSKIVTINNEDFLINGGTFTTYISMTQMTLSQATTFDRIQFFVCSALNTQLLAEPTGIIQCLVYAGTMNTYIASNSTQRAANLRLDLRKNTAIAIDNVNGYGFYQPEAFLSVRDDVLTTRTESYTLQAGTYTLLVSNTSGTVMWGAVPKTGSLTKASNNGTSWSDYNDEVIAFALQTVPADNTSPTNITLSSATIAENSPALTVIGSLSVTDAENSPQTYSLVAGTGDTDNGLFEISGSNLRLKSGTSLNYEAKSSYSVRIKATDSADSTYFFEKAFTISVTNVNEAPSNINLSASSIQENNAVNAVIGALSAIDPDTGDTSFTFSITGGADQAKFNISGNNLRASEAFDYEAPADANGDNVYAVDITATDTGGLTFTKSFSISVTNNTADDPVVVPSSTVFTEGKVVVTNGSNPTSIPFLLNGSALPIGSVVRWTGNNNQRFVKKSGSSTAFTAIPVTAPAEWKWDAGGQAAWDVLQSI